MHALSSRICLSLLIGMAIAGSVSVGAEKKAQAFTPASAERAGLLAPVAGLFAPGDRAELRTIVGAPGAAVFGDPVGLPSEIRRLWISPAGSFAIVAAEGGYPLWSIQSRGGAPVMTRIEAGIAPAEVVAFSPDGSAAALYSQQVRRLYVVTGLPGEPGVREIDLRSLPGTLTAAALGERSALVAIGSYDGHAGAVDIVNGDGSYENVWTGGEPASLRFAGEELLISEPAGNRVLLLSRAASHWAVKQVAGVEDGLEEPGQIEVLADRKWAVVANRKAESVLWIEIASGKSHRVDLPSVALSMTPVRVRNAVVISTGAPESHWFLTGGIEEPVLTFISESMVGAVRQ